MDLEWIKPSKIGNEATKDAYQIHTEVIQKYVATLRVVEQQPEQEKGEEKEDSNLEKAYDRSTGEESYDPRATASSWPWLVNDLP